MIQRSARLTDTGIRITPDPGRAIVRFFVPGREDVGPGDSRAESVIDRIMGLEEHEITAALRDIEGRLADRHHRLYETFEQHAAQIAHRLDAESSLTIDRRRLLGAAFTHEYAIEGAALCNPSIVACPEQPASGETAFVMSVRGIGEGHRSSIGFRTGAIDRVGTVTLDAPGSRPRTAPAMPGQHHRSVLHRRLAEADDDHENAAYVLDELPECFGDEQLRSRTEALIADAPMRRNAASTAQRIVQLATSSYRVEFTPDTQLSERVLWPHASAEAHGMEDARFVEITDGSGPRYCATYTAFDGVNVSQHLLTTDDFVSFAITPMAGSAAKGKGLALFPRRVGDRYVALSRADRETNSVAYSDDLLCWDNAEVVAVPRRRWEVLQVGNCGSPIETSEGWLVLTHGVGAMRTYSIGAMLLDLDEPHRVIATTDEPLLAPGRSCRDGYVPNVVYSCGALAVGGRLVLPYGIGDQMIAIATVEIDDVIAAMSKPAHRTVTSSQPEGDENA